jgi:P4 family phage/plasmid primase-like protien
VTVNINPDPIPSELKGRDQWLMWDASSDAPRRPHWRGDFGVSWTDPDDWHSFEDALSAAQERESWGIGYVFAYENEEYPRGLYGGLDLDGCLNERGGPKDWLPSLKPFIDADAYIERSPSGDGLHVPLVGFEPPEWWQDSHFSEDEHEGVEAYGKKFFTFTGDSLDVSGGSVAEDVDVSSWLLEAHEAIHGELPTLSDNSGQSDNYDTDTDTEIGVYDVISSASHPEGERTEHPYHGSGTGTNFLVDEGGETFRCWRHSCTGNAGHLLGMDVGVISCGEWESGGLDSDTWREIFDEARGRGYDIPEPSGSRNLAADVPDVEDLEGADPESVATWEHVRTMYADPETDDKHARYAAVLKLTAEYKFMTATDTEALYVYHPDSGVFEKEADGDHVVNRELQRGLGAHYTQHEKREIVGHLKAQSYVDRETFNAGDKDAPLLCVGNGVLNVETRELHDHAPVYRFTRRVPVDYVPDAECENVEAFMDDITARKEDKQTMYEMVGNALLPHYDYSAFMVLFGEGSNGKSTFYDVVEELLGTENVAGADLQKLSQNRFATATLEGKLANIAPDMPSTKVSDLGDIKALTGGDTIQAEKKGQDAFEFTNTAKLMFGANRPPVLGETSYAVERRLLPIRLPYEFTARDDENPDARDKTELLAELTDDEELSGFLNKALEGVDRLKQTGEFSLPEAPGERMEYYEQYSDPIKEYAINCIENEPGRELTKDELYNAYTDFCRANNHTVKRRDVFFQQLRRTSFRVSESRPMVDGERVRCLTDARFTDEGLEHASDSAKGRLEYANTPEETTETTAADTPTSLSELRPEGNPFYTVTVEVKTFREKTDDRGPVYEGTFSDRTGTLEVVDWFGDARFNSIEEDEFYRLHDVKASYDSNGSLQLELVQGTTEVEEIQQGVGYTSTVDAGKNSQVDAAADGGQATPADTEPVDTDDLEGVKAQVHKLITDTCSSGDEITVSRVAGRLSRVCSPDGVAGALDRLSNRKNPPITPVDDETYEVL